MFQGETLSLKNSILLSASFKLFSEVTMKTLFAALTVIFLSACSVTTPNLIRVYSASFILKDSEVSYRDLMESTPFKFNDRMFVMISDRDRNKIMIYEGSTLIHSEPSDLNFSSAIVDNGKVHIFGTADDQILKIESADLTTWTTPVVVKQRVADRSLFNVSVSKVTAGGYVMSYETCEPNTVCFNIRFAVSQDLLNWSDQGSFFSPEAYAACPTIREFDGVYYMLYLKDYNGHWATAIARSADLTTWTTSSVTVLSALNTDGETINNSDADLVEFDGQTILTYAIGDQRTFTHIKLARYNGSMREFFEQFFK